MIEATMMRKSKTPQMINHALEKMILPLTGASSSWGISSSSWTSSFGFSCLFNFIAPCFIDITIIGHEDRCQQHRINREREDQNDGLDEEDGHEVHLEENRLPERSPNDVDENV